MCSGSPPPRLPSTALGQSTNLLVGLSAGTSEVKCDLGRRKRRRRRNPGERAVLEHARAVDDS